jgi:hypothetical protein
LESDGYILLSGSSFNEEGEAYVQGKSVGIKRCIIDTKGRIVREAKFSGKKIKNYEYRKPFVYSTTIQESSFSLDGIYAFQENGKYGFSNNQTIVLPPQLSAATDFRGGYAKVKKDGKYGVMKLFSGSFNGQLSKDIVKVENGKSEDLDYLLSIPSTYSDKLVTVQLKQDDGTFVKLTSIPSMIDKQCYVFNPAPKNGRKEMTYLFSVSVDDLLLWNDTQKVVFQYVVYYPPILSIPQIDEKFKVDEEGYVRADSENKVDVYAIIENKSSEPLSITLTIGGNGVVEETKKMSVAPSSSAKISTSINAIRERKLVEVFVNTSTGLKQERAIKVKPFI